LLSGSDAFDDLSEVVEKLGDLKGMTWARDQTELLKSAKRYLKSDYKVRCPLSAQLNPAFF
jgi:hypothetical protein